MRERPPLPDNALAAALAAGWGMVARAVEFLPAATPAPGRSGSSPATASAGSSRSGGERDPWRPLDGFTLLVYPWVEGVVAMERRLTGRQWAGLGRFRPALHRAERLGRAVAAARPELVLCHADLHLANLLVDAEGRLWVVDWDGLQLAPRERDLLFATGPQRARFLEGYGPVTLDRPTVAYYRWEWVVQELADYGGRVLHDRLGDGTGGTPWRSAGGCSRPVTWSRWPGGPTRA